LRKPWYDHHGVAAYFLPEYSSAGCFELQEQLLDAPMLKRAEFKMQDLFSIADKPEMSGLNDPA